MKNTRAPFPTRAAAGLVLAVSLALAGCGGGDGSAGGGNATAGADGKKEEQKVPAVPVEVSRVAKRPISASYSGTANLEAPAEAQVVAKTSGVVLQVLAEEGDQVRAGQTLARIDPDRARLEVERTGAAVRKLQSNFERAQELVASKLVSAESVEQIRFDLEAARASHDLARLELSYTNIVAPFDGVVAQRMVKTGNLVALNAPAFRVVDTSRLEAVLNVPEREVATLRTGMPLRMLVDAIPGTVFEGRVDRTSPVVDAGSGTFRVVAAFDGGTALRPGMFGRIEVVYDQRKDALTMPRIALLENEGEPAVFVVRENKAVRVPVQLGYINGELAEVRGGLSEGDDVVTAGKVAIRDGSEVEVINAAPVDAGAGEIAQAAKE